MDSPSTFNEFIEPYLSLATELADFGRSVVDSLLPDGLTGADMPDATVNRLHVVGTINYRGGLSCLGEPESSLAAFSLLRGLLEAWSHVEFILDAGEGGDTRCRALRFERGAHSEWAGNAAAAPPGDPTLWQQAHDQRARDLDELWRQYGCSGSERKQGGTTKTIKDLSKKPGMEWVSAVWRTSSGAVHMVGVEFALRSDGQGTTELVWALPSQRATWLIFLAASYSHLTTTAVEILQPGARERAAVHEVFRKIAEDPQLRLASAGSYDH
jgi:hypothetical protein